MREEQLDELLQAIIKEATKDDLFLHYLFTSGIFTGIRGSLFDQFFSEFVWLSRLSAPQIASGMELAYAFHTHHQRIESQLLGNPAFHAHTPVLARLFSRSLLKDVFSMEQAPLPDEVYNLLVLMGLKILTESAIASSHVLLELQGAKDLAGSGTAYRVIYLGNFLDYLLGQLASKEVSWHVNTLLLPFTAKHPMGEETQQAVVDTFRFSVCKTALVAIGLSLGLPGLIHGLIQSIPHFEILSPSEEATNGALEKTSRLTREAALSKLLSGCPEALAAQDHPFFEALKAKEGDFGFTTRFYDLHYLRQILEKALEKEFPEIEEPVRQKAVVHALKGLEAEAVALKTREAVRDKLLQEIRQHLPQDLNIPREAVLELVDKIDLNPDALNQGSLMAFNPETPPTAEEFKHAVRTFLENALCRQFPEKECRGYREKFEELLYGESNQSLLKHLSYYSHRLAKTLKQKKSVCLALSQTTRPFLDTYVLARAITEPLTMWQEVFKLSDREAKEEKTSLQVPPISI